MSLKRIPILILLSFSILLISCTSPEEDDTTAPAAPANLTFDANLSVDGQVYISWDAPADKDVASYHIYRAAELANFVEIASVTATNYLDTHLDYDTQYSYQVTAKDEDDNESPSSATVSVTPYNQFSPNPPAGLSIKAHNIEADLNVNVELAWSGNTENDFSHYKIYKSTSPTFQINAESFLDSLDGIYYLDEDVIPGNTYYYRLIAFDLGGFDSDPTIVVSDTPLEVPTLIRPTDLEESVSSNPTFEWQNVDMANKYKIVVRTASQSGDIWESEMSATTANTMSITYPANATTALSANTRYFWFVAGYSKDTDEVNVYSETYSFRTL